MISDGINGSTLSYTVVYSDLITNRICDRAVLNPTMCKDRLCTHLFNTITSECSTTADLAISIFATNILGEGPPTTVFHGIHILTLLWKHNNITIVHLLF